jgi:hypothetical protein
VLADPVGTALADWVETCRPWAASVPVSRAGDLHRAVIDAAERVTDEESFGVALRFIRESASTTSPLPVAAREDTPATSQRGARASPRTHWPPGRRLTL